MIRSGSAHGQAHGVTMLAVANELSRHRRLATQLPAELAHDASFAPLIEVDLLARQGRAPTVSAAIAIGLQRADAAAQERALESVDVRQRQGHDDPLSPPRAALLPAHEREFRPRRVR